MNSVIVLLAPSLCGHLFNSIFNSSRVSLEFLSDFVVAQCDLIAALPRLRPHPEILNHIPNIYVAVHKYIEKESEINFLLALRRFRAFQFYDALVKTHDAPLMRNATGDERLKWSRLASSGVGLG